MKSCESPPLLGSKFPTSDMNMWLDSSSGSELDEEEKSDEDDVIVSVLDRDSDESGLIYQVTLRGQPESQWMSRSDLWDEGVNSHKMEAYDFRNPVDWDDVCYYCKCNFEDSDQGGGCEECICDICEERCRHYNGINYGCPRHSVV